MTVRVSAGRLTLISNVKITFSGQEEVDTLFFNTNCAVSVLGLFTGKLPISRWVNFQHTFLVNWPSVLLPDSRVGTVIPIGVVVADKNS